MLVRLRKLLRLPFLFVTERLYEGSLRQQQISRTFHCGFDAFIITASYPIYRLLSLADQSPAFIFLLVFLPARDDHKALQAGVRTGSEVIFTYLQACTNDARDISLDYKLSGPLLAGIPRVNCDPKELFLEDCHPDQNTGRG